MKEESVTIYVIMTILTTLSTAMLSIEILKGFIMTNQAEAQQQPLSKSNPTATTTQNPNKIPGNFDNQTAIHEVINATRNTNATRVLAGQIINATTSMMSNQTRWEYKQLYGHIKRVQKILCFDFFSMVLKAFDS